MNDQSWRYRFWERKRNTDTESSALSHAAYQPHTDPLSLQGSQWCSQTQTNSRSRVLHKEYFGTNHHNNLSLTYLKYRLNIKFYQKQMELMLVCSASFSIRSDACQG